MGEEPVEIDIIMRQNVEDEGAKATRAIDKMAEASVDAQKQNTELLELQRAAIARIKKELAPLEQAWKKVNIGTQDAKVLEERKRLSPIIKSLRTELELEEKTLGELEKRNVSLAEKQSTLLTQMRDVKNEMAQMKMAGQQESAAYKEKEQQLQSLATAHRELAQEQKLLVSGSAQMQGFLSGLSALSGLLSAGGGALALFNANSEEYAKIQTKVQSLMAITIGLQQLQNTLHQTSAFRIQTVTRAKQLWTAANIKLATSLGISTVAAQALMAILTLGLSAAIGVAVTLIDRYISKQRAAREEQQKFADSVSQNAASQIASYEKLRVTYNKLGNDIKAKEKIIKDNQSAFSQLGVSINDVNDADTAFIKNTEAFKSAIMQRARAAAAMDLAAEKYKESLRKQEESGKIKPSVWRSRDVEFDELGRPVWRDKKAVKLEKEAGEIEKEGDKLIAKSVAYGNAANEILTQNGIKLAEKAGKTQREATKKQVDEFGKASEKLAKLSADIQKETDAAVVAAMQEGRDKKLAELKADYDARMALIAQRQKEIEELEEKHGVDGSKQKGQLTALADAEKSKYDAQVKAVTEGSAAALDGVWAEINARFQTENQRRLVEINRFYNEQIAKARENGATQMELDQITADRKRDIELEKQHIALETLDFETQIALKRAQIADRNVILQTEREEKILRIQIAAAQKRLKKLKELQAGGGDTAKDIEAVTTEVEALNAELGRIPTRKFKELADYAQQILDGLGSFASNFDEDLGGLFDMVSGAVGGIASLGGGIATGNPQEIIKGTMQLLDTVGKVIKANKQANEEIRKFNLSLAQQAVDYSLAVIRSIKDIKSETDSIFTSNYTNTLTQGMSGYNAAIEKQAELMRKLGGATVKTGVEKKKFLFITYGTRDVYGNLLKQYPELIKKDGTLNRELAETLKKSGNLKEETANLIDSILQASDAANEAMQSVESELQNLVGSMGLELKKALDDAFVSGTDSAKAMTDSVVKMLKDISTQKLFNAVFGGIFSQLEDRMKKSFGDGGDRDLSDDINWFMDKYGQHVDEYNKGLAQLREAIEKQYGVDPFADDGGRKAVNKGIAQASQDSIDELNGRLTFLVMKVSDIGTINATYLDLGREQLLVQRAMLGSLETIAENSEFLKKLDNIADDIAKLNRDGINIKR